MNSREKYNGSKEDFFYFLKDEVVKLFKDKLKIEGNQVTIPDNEELDYQVKFDLEENYGDFTIKVKWGEKPEEITELEENTTETEDKTFEF